MADQGKWFKLWESSLDDHDLENLTIHEWFCWARLGVYIKKHGVGGKIRIRYPGTSLINLFRVSTFDDVINMIKAFPNYHFEEGNNVTANVTVESVTRNVICKNWNKYQGDFSGDRVRRHRIHVTANVTAQEEKRRDVEEKRREEKRTTPLSPPASFKQEHKEYELPNPAVDPIKCLVLTFKTTKGFPFDDRAWDKANWGRSAAAAKNLLALCKDFESAESCLKDLGQEYDGKGLSWTFETVCRNAGEWLKKNGRIDEHASRTGLRMAIAKRNATGKSEALLAQTTERAVLASVRDGDDNGSRDKENDNRSGRVVNETGLE